MIAGSVSNSVVSRMWGPLRAKSLVGMNLDSAARRLFVPARRPGRVGAEVELIPVTADSRRLPVDPAWVSASLDDPCRAAAKISFEPGGQLELSLPPAELDTFVAGLDRLLRHTTQRLAAGGVRLEAAGTNPYHSCRDVPLRRPTARYRAMQRLFDEVGPDGRRMMRLTASLQITIDLLPGRAGGEQWLVANLAGPGLAAAYANSPWLDGRPAGFPGARTRIWQGVDLRRTGYDGRHLSLDEPLRAYAAFARAAEPLPIPESADPRYHLSTLFPPVRPRGGYLELRYLDAQPLERIGELIRRVAWLLYDDVTRRAALDLLRPQLRNLGEAWTQAADGCSPVADDLLAIIDGRRPGGRAETREPSPLHGIVVGAA